MFKIRLFTISLNFLLISSISYADVLVQYQDLRSMTATQLSDSIIDRELMITLTFDSDTTAIPTQYQSMATDIIEKSKNPGLGIRALHSQGITGKGINVAIIDQNLISLNHPEFAGKIVSYKDWTTAPANSQGSMHGPAVASLLVGTAIGTAPDAKLYYASTPSWLQDAQYYADALNWIISENAKLPTGQQIRVVSVSAVPAGAGTPFTKNPAGNAAWITAVAAARVAGIEIIDCSSENGFTAIAKYDLDDPDNIDKVSSFYNPPMQGILYVPSDRTEAKEYTAGNYQWHYTGKGGSSWTAPYVSGLFAMGWQLHPELTGSQMKQFAFDTAYISSNGMKVINPVAFIDKVKAYGTTVTSINGVCGGSNGGTFSIAPTTNFCTAGTVGSVTGTGPWYWTCGGSSGGTTSNCSAYQGSVTPVNANNTTKGKFFMGGDDQLTVSNSGMTVYGGSGYDVVSIASSVYNVVLDQNIEQLNFTDRSTAFTFKQTGNLINIYDGIDNYVLIASIPMQSNGTKLSFNDGMLTAVLINGVMSVK